MKKFTKILALVLLAVLAVTAMVACKKKEDVSEFVTTGDPDKDKAQLEAAGFTIDTFEKFEEGNYYEDRVAYIEAIRFDEGYDKVTTQEEMDKVMLDYILVMYFETTEVAKQHADELMEMNYEYDEEYAGELQTTVNQKDKVVTLTYRCATAVLELYPKGWVEDYGWLEPEEKFISTGDPVKDQAKLEAQGYEVQILDEEDLEEGMTARVLAYKTNIQDWRDGKIGPEEVRTEEISVVYCESESVAQTAYAEGSEMMKGLEGIEGMTVGLDLQGTVLVTTTVRTGLQI